MRDLLEEVEDRLANCMKELNSKSQEAQRYKVFFQFLSFFFQNMFRHKSKQAA